MNDTEQITALYTRMYDGMVRKDAALLEEVLDDSFVLVHMTGLHQGKEVFIRAVLDRTLNYFSAKHESMDVTVQGDRAELIGKSRVSAAVFGGGRGNWRLRQDLTLKQTSEGWKISHSVASTY